jgi:predicted dehydrogenase
MLQQKIEIIKSFVEVKNQLSWEDYQEFIKKFSPEVKVIEEQNVEPLFIELREFVDSVKNDKPVPVSGEEATDALKIALKAIESSKKGEAVKI